MKAPFVILRGGFLEHFLDLGTDDTEFLEGLDFIELGREGLPVTLKGKVYMPRLEDRMRNSFHNLVRLPLQG